MLIERSTAYGRCSLAAKFSPFFSSRTAPCSTDTACLGCALSLQRIDLLYNETMNVRSAGSQYEALGGPTGWLAKFRAAVSSGL